MKNKDVIVSLTTFPAASEYAVGAVESILRGDTLPDKLVLYVTKAQFGEAGLPEKLKEIEKRNPIFEIRDYGKDIRSYRKLVPALKDFPDDIIVTIDDDMDYDKEMLTDLLKLHDEFPDRIIAHRAKKVSLFHPYKKWKKLRWYDFIRKSDQSGFNVIQTGCGGVLYPPGALKKEMIDEELFTRIAPTADDFWFWAAAVANGTEIMPFPYGKHNKPKELGKPRSLSLKTVNFKSGTDLNDKSFRSILEEYPVIRERLEKG